MSQKILNLRMPDLNSAFSHSKFIKAGEYLYFKGDDPNNYFQRYYILLYLQNFLSPIPENVPLDNYTRFFTSLLDKKLSNKIRETILSKIQENNTNDESQLFSLRDNDFLENQAIEYFSIVFLNAIKKQLQCINIENNPAFLKISDIAKTFKLDDIEKKILIYEYIIGSNEEFDNFFTTNSNDQRYNGNRIISFKSIGKILNIHPHLITKGYSPESKLSKYGLLVNDTDMAQELIYYINGCSDAPLLNNYISEDTKDYLPMDYFQFENDELTIVNGLTKSVQSKNGIRILFYGKAGTGKTELAKSMIKSNGFKAYQIKRKLKDNYDSKTDADFRIRALNAYENSIDIESSFIIVDEADELLTTKSSLLTMYNDNQKGKINLFLDNSETNQIWITNTIFGIDESTMRRFDYCLAFPELNKKQKAIIWGNILKVYNADTLVSSEELDNLAEKYECNAGNIRNAVKNYLRFDELRTNKELFHKIVNASMNSYLRLLNTENTITNNNNSIKYSEKCLNIDGDLESYMTIIDNFNEAWKKGDAEFSNMNILLHGYPGTGKTELAKYIARRIDRKLIMKSPSDILSKWVGGTEQQIVEAFKAAEKENGILFIDETDAIAGTRDNAQHSWESSMVNELLVRMESFHGIFISATNRYNDLDPAIIRRFNLKIGFDYLNINGVRQLFDLYFQTFCDNLVSDEELLSLKYLTPADFKIVYQKFYFMDKKFIEKTQIIEMLEAEQHLRESSIKRKIGF